MMTLYEFPPTRSIRVRWTLQELGVPFEAVTVNLVKGENRSPDYLRINPAGKVPALVDGDLALTESIAIVLYLAEKHLEKGLLPTDRADRARLDQWLLFTATELEQPLWRIARHTALYPENRRLPDEVTLAREDFVAMARVLDGHMAGREFVAGERVSVGDFVLAYTLDWANEIRLLEQTPLLRSYMLRMYERPAAPPRIAAAMAAIGG
ncbi:MAG: glutathione S-transferase family protein [Alphaproteobacteria bacterium]|nr:glutathione S-transferase family protein [Alphaproteobacteria bacterium]